MGEGIIDDGDFLAGNPAFKVDRAAAIFKAAVGDECRSRVNILEGIGVIDIGERAVCDGEGTVGVLLPICLLAIGTDDVFSKVQLVTVTFPLFRSWNSAFRTCSFV